MAETVSGIVRSFSGNHAVLATPSAVFSVEQLLGEADALYRRVSVQTGSRIALSGLSARALMTAFVAFDGNVEAMLLLPSSLDDASKKRLVVAAGCTHIMNAEGVFALPDGKCGDSTSDFKVTQWLLATSGTTGTPKLITHTLATITRSVKRDRIRGAGFVWGLLYDPSRFAGLQVLLQALFSGSALIVSDSPEFEEQIEAFDQHRINALSATPSLWRKLLMDGRIKECPLRQITLGGEIADQQILDALKQGFPTARIVHIYASTEVGTAFSVHDGRAGFPVAWLRDDSSPVPMRVRDDAHLLIKPLKLPDGAEIVQRLDEDGYLDTEDLVCIAGDRVMFSGRASGAINVGGNKVIPEFIEQQLRHVEGVQDVRVFGKKSSMLGQIVAAEVVACPTSELSGLRLAIMNHCQTAFEKWQIPAFISFVDELKESAAGKRDRRK